jgi:hypothetical protein
MSKRLQIIPRQKGSTVSNVITAGPIDFRQVLKIVNFVPRDMSLRHYVLSQQGIDLNLYATIEGRFDKLDLSYTDVIPPVSDPGELDELGDVLDLTNCYIYVLYMKGDDTLYLRSEWQINDKGKFRVIGIGESSPNRGRDVRSPDKGSGKDRIPIPFKYTEGGKDVKAFICISPADMQLPWKAVVGKEGLTTKENLKRRCALPAFFGKDKLEPEDSTDPFVIEDIVSTTDVVYEMHRLNKFFTHFLGKYIEQEQEQNEEGQLREAVLHICGVNLDSLRWHVQAAFEDILGKAAKKKASSPYDVIFLDNIAAQVGQDSKSWALPAVQKHVEHLRKGELDNIHFETVMSMARQCANSISVNMYCQALINAIKSDHFKKYVANLAESEDKATCHYAYKLFLRVREDLGSWPAGRIFLVEDYKENKELIEKIFGSDLDEDLRALALKMYQPAILIEEKDGKAKTVPGNLKKALGLLKKNGSPEFKGIVEKFEKAISVTKETKGNFTPQRLKQLFTRTADEIPGKKFTELPRSEQRVIVACDTMFFAIHTYFLIDNLSQLGKGKTDAKTIYATAGSLVSLADDTVEISAWMAQKYPKLAGYRYFRSLPKITRVVKVFGPILSTIDYFITLPAIYDSASKGKWGQVAGHSFVALSAAFSAAAATATIMNVGTISLGVIAVTPGGLLLIAIGALLIGALILLLSDDSLSPKEKWLRDSIWGKNYRGRKSIEKIRADLLAFYQLVYGFAIDGDLSGQELELEIEPRLLSLNSAVNVQFGYWHYSGHEDGAAIIQSKETLTFEWLESITLKKGVAAKSTYGSFGLTSVETETMDEDKSMVEKIELEALLRSNVRLNSDTHSFIALVSLDVFGFGDNKAYVKNAWVYPGANRNQQWQTIRKDLTGQMPSDPEVMVLEQLEEYMLANPRGGRTSMPLDKWLKTKIKK